MRRTCLEISKSAFFKNVEEVRRLVGDAKIMPVIKANAYGTYLNKELDLINEFEIVAVAIVEEAIQLRNLGYRKDIFVLNQPCIEEIDEIIKYNIVVGVSSSAFLEEVKKYNNCIRIHIELETGMGRTGVLSSQLDEFMKLIAESNVKVEGIYTHLSSTDVDYGFTKKQIDLFEDGVRKIKGVFNDIKYVHSSASNGILNFDLGICNMVRPGLILYGYPSCKTTIEKIELHPVAKFKSSISFIKEIDVGDAISYGRSFVASDKMMVATVGCGYADGVMRKLSNKGYVSVNGKRCKILGNVCMDSFMIDVTNCCAKIGDDVYLFDNNIVTLDEISNICETINYEILTTISERVPRVFVD